MYQTALPWRWRSHRLTPASQSYWPGCPATIAHPQPSVLNSMCTVQYRQPTGLHLPWPKNLRLALSKRSLSKKRCRHVASLGVAGAPSPSPMGAWEVPSPQSASSVCSSTVSRTSGRHRHIHCQAYGCDRRARRNCSRNIEREHAAAKFTHAVLTGEEVKTSAVAVVALVGIIFVECIVFAGGDVDDAALTDVRPSKAKRASVSNIATRVLVSNHWVLNIQVNRWKTIFTHQPPRN